MSEPMVPATPLETAIGYDLLRAAFAVTLFRRARRGSTEPIRVTKRDRDAITKALPPGQRFQVRVAIDAAETVFVWLEAIEDDGTRPGIVRVLGVIP